VRREKDPREGKRQKVKSGKTSPLPNVLRSKCRPTGYCLLSHSICSYVKKVGGNSPGRKAEEMFVGIRETDLPKGD
jgi:hypothetical protein